MYKFSRCSVMIKRGANSGFSVPGITSEDYTELHDKLVEVLNQDVAKWKNRIGIERSSVSSLHSSVLANLFSFIIDAVTTDMSDDPVKQDKIIDQILDGLKDTIKRNVHMNKPEEDHNVG